MMIGGKEQKKAEVAKVAEPAKNVTAKAVVQVKTAPVNATAMAQVKK